MQRKTFVTWAWKLWKNRTHERERQVIVLSNSRISSSAKFWLSCCPFAEGFLFKRSHKQANQSRITTEGKTIFRFPATEGITPAILESHCSAWSTNSLKSGTIVAFSVLVVDLKGFVASACNVCIETERFRSVFWTFHYIMITSMCYENHLALRKHKLYLKSQGLYGSLWARETLGRLSQWSNILATVPS